MKIKCDDGIVREFRTSSYLKDDLSKGVYKGDLRDSVCLNCNYNFGIHDTKILKPLWKKHNCSF